MNDQLHLPKNSLPAIKSQCCKAHLTPLLQRIALLQNKLLLETDRRENEYNELLRMIITIRKDQVKEQPQSSTPLALGRKRQKSKGPRVMTSPTVRKGGFKIAINKRATSKIEQKEKINISIEEKHGQTQKAESELLVKENGATDKSQVFQSKFMDIQKTIGRQQEEIDKIKELNDYLMGQLLGIFESIRRWQESEIPRKNIASEETVTSMVLQGDLQHENIKIINKQNNCSSSRLSKSDLTKADLGQVAARVNEHQSILSDLIELTRNLSSQIKHLPTQWSVVSCTEL